LSAPYLTVRHGIGEGRQSTYLRRSTIASARSRQGQGPTKSPIVCLGSDSRHWGLKQLDLNVSLNLPSNFFGPFTYLPTTLTGDIDLTRVDDPHAAAHLGQYLLGGGNYNLGSYPLTFVVPFLPGHLEIGAMLVRHLSASALTSSSASQMCGSRHWHLSP
jgi:hypothetical protein